ncbi:hypothetical protein [Azospirillum tabaci]|uniref:hypothetical protein n=1 Tax=Azospirillum tabaci TaxID=2752310 RepID=UPI0016607BE0|nr:hypothetical protein [Azospirillum tabaci]
MSSNTNQQSASSLYIFSADGMWAHAGEGSTIEEALDDAESKDGGYCSFELPDDHYYEYEIECVKVPKVLEGKYYDMMEDDDYDGGESVYRFMEHCKDASPNTEVRKIKVTETKSDRKLEVI